MIRIEVFHTVYNLFFIIGKRFQDAGLRDLCVESGAIPDGSVAGITEGRKYNRAIKLHMLLYNASMRLVWKIFSPWIENDHTENVPRMMNTLTVIDNFQNLVNQASFQE